MGKKHKSSKQDVANAVILPASPLKNLIEVMFEGGLVRIQLVDGEPWFCAEDVCTALEYTNSRQTIDDHCRSKGVTKRYTLTAGGNQEMTFINEGNLYRLIIKSKKPAAQRFEALVMDEILPAIRKTGRYEVNPKGVHSVNTSARELELSNELHTRLFYALEKNYSDSTVMWALLKAGALDQWITASIRSLVRYVDNAIVPSCFHKHTLRLAKLGLLDIRDHDQRPKEYKVLGDALRKQLELVRNDDDQRPGLDVLLKQSTDVTVH